MRLGELLESGNLVCLAGDLGAGKTTMAQGIARGWGSLDPVTSPTFVLINEYRRADNERLFHVDAFRLSSPDEARMLGLEELFDQGAGPVMIEWPEKLSDVLPDERLWIHLSWQDDSRRRLEIAATGPAYASLLKVFRQVAFGG